MARSAFESISDGLRAGIAHAEGAHDTAAVHRAAPIDVRTIRAGLGLSQSQFANQVGVSVATVRNWEQGRRAPRGPARVLLRVIQHDPEAVRRVLAATR